MPSHEEWSHYNENIIEDQKDFVFVKYNGLHLKSMENLQSCISLRVCIFSNNFVTDIQPLQSCVKLIKLDLHGNQIKTLPDRNFWGGLKNLKLLYLHDNGFAKLKNICVLAACASLVGLTMFDCPCSDLQTPLWAVQWFEDPFCGQCSDLQTPLWAVQWFEDPFCGQCSDLQTPLWAVQWFADHYYEPTLKTFTSKCHIRSKTFNT
ncbi:hypothetical protein U0070_024587 [Myodes glareolus]|uniref:Uncharacterized protein n=1 Tax=Myodes glareolus TaxID=447135 RepID=A0AAW0IDH8_MYOGA